MKKIILSIALLYSVTINAQDIASMIPENARAVASLKGENLLQLMSASEFNQTFLGKKILQEAARNTKKNKLNSIEDFGIRLNSTIYYYYQTSDSISYHCLLIPIADADKFESQLNESQKKKIERQGNTSKLYNRNDKSLLVWNKDVAYLVMGQLNSGFIEKDTAMSERYGIKKISYNDYYNQPDEEQAVVDSDYVVVDTAAAMTSEEGGDTTVVAAPEELEMNSAVPSEDKPAAPIAENEEAVMQIPLEDKPAAPVPENEEVVDAPVMPDNNYYKAYNSALSQQDSIKRNITKAWVSAFVNKNFVSGNASHSILNNQSYLKSLDKNAAATLYVADLQNLFTGMLPSYYGLLATSSYSRSYNTGYGSFDAKVYLEKSKMRITTNMELTEEKARIFKRVYDHKLNKKFLKYINTENAVGFLGMSMNTEAYLQETPKLLEDSYSQIFNSYKEEIGIGAAMLSTLLDEKAIAKVIKGDALLVVTGFSPKEYEYTSYDYDQEAFETKTITKKKTETLPDFLFMMSSDDADIFLRLLNYGVHKGKMVQKEGIYSLSEKMAQKSPYNTHFLIKDGIVFCSSSLKDITDIKNDRFNGNVSKEQRKLLKDNNFIMYFDPKKIAGKYDTLDGGNVEWLKDLNKILNNSGKIYAQSTGIKGNSFSSELTVDVPDGNENALKYFFSQIEQIAKLSKKNNTEIHD